MTSTGPRIYNLFPPMAGTVEDWTAHLPRIAEMGFNWVFLNPFHETGSSGSLYAVKDYFTLDAGFRGKQRKSSDDLLRGFVKAAEKHGLSVMMDLVVNHTAKDGRLPAEHPEWFRREHDGSLMSPFAIDPGDIRKKTVWYDLAEINYDQGPERQRIVDYFSGVVRHYLALGFRGFRCDAAYKVPMEVWRTLIDAAKRAQPDSVFFAESLGALQEQVLSMQGGGFDFLFNSSKWWDFEAPWLLDQYQMFRQIAPSVAFPETHDTERLAADLAAAGNGDPKAIERAYRRAYLFAAAFSAAVMIPMGFEYGFRKKLHVVETKPDDWKESRLFDLSSFIGETNQMKAAAPALNQEGPQRAFRLGDGRVTCLERQAERGNAWAVTLINNDHGSDVRVRTDGLDGRMRSGREITPGSTGESFSAGAEVTVGPGAVRIFASA
jgi:starch synthase (maltosyl-transferring)